MKNLRTIRNGHPLLRSTTIRGDLPTTSLNKLIILLKEIIEFLMRILLTYQIIMSQSHLIENALYMLLNAIEN